jgi:putative endonuclease
MAKASVFCYIKFMGNVKIKSIYLRPWFVYVIICNNGTYYTGITRDLERRLKLHSTGKGAKYTRVYGVKAMIYSKKFKNHRLAALREIEIKKMSRAEKIRTYG